MIFRFPRSKTHFKSPARRPNRKLSFLHAKHTTPIQNTDIFVFFGNQ